MTLCYVAANTFFFSFSKAVCGTISLFAGKCKSYVQHFILLLMVFQINQFVDKRCYGRLKICGGV